MVDLYPNIRFPNVSFDWLGELPEIYQEQRGQAELRKGLAGLKSSDAASLRAAANRAMATGTKQGIEAATRLYTAAQAQDNLAQKAQAEREYNAALASGKIAPGGGRAEPPSGAQEGPTIDFSLPANQPNSGPMTPAPLPSQRIAPAFPQPPSSVGPQSSLQPAPAPAGPMSPSDAIITAAQRGPQGAAGPQFAGPVTAPVGQTSATPELAPETVRGALARPAVVPQAPRPPAPKTEAEIKGEDPVALAKRDLGRIGAQLAVIPFGSAGTSAGRGLQAEFHDALTRAKATPEDRSFLEEKIRRAQENVSRQTAGQPPLPDLTWQEFKANAATVGERYKATLDVWKTYQKSEQDARNLSDKLRQMRTILDNPKFAPGEPGYLDFARNWGVSLVQTFKAMGLPVDMTEQEMRSITGPVALREAYQALTNQAVIAMLGGSLGRQISDSDVKYMGAALGTLSQTKEGLELIHEFMQRASDRAEKSGITSGNYFRDHQTLATPYGMEEAVRNEMKKGDDIVAGKLKEKMDRLTETASPQVRVTPEDEGRAGTDAQGNRWIVKGGRLVPLRNGP